MSHDDKDQLWNVFFRLFSRLEYALKRTGTKLYLAGDEHEARPNWDRFAADIASLFDPAKNRNLQGAVSYLLRNPPRKQVVRESALGWAALQQQNQSELAWILLLVRRIRNNLFHGGKFASGSVADPARDARLLDAAIVVLRECASLEPRVSAHMEGFL